MSQEEESAELIREGEWLRRYSERLTADVQELRQRVEKFPI